MGLGLSGAQDKRHTSCALRGEQGGGEDQHGDAGVSLWSVPSVRGGGVALALLRPRMQSTLLPEAGDGGQ